jgi:hypothetical protein
MLLILVKEHDRELSAQVLDKVEAVLHVQRDDDLAIALAAEDVSCGVFDFLADAIIVIELAVDDNVDLAVG